jgi:H+-translocating NAD(P) transhydrogenase subunit alpha
MKIAIVKERRAHERRVAASPDSVKQMVGMGLQPVVESDAGAAACFPDAAYSAAGATIAGDAVAALADAEIVLKVQRPLIGAAPGIEEPGGTDELGLIKRGAALIGLLQPLRHPEDVAAYASAGIAAFAMELMPRITRAQTMDVL